MVEVMKGKEERGCKVTEEDILFTKIAACILVTAFICCLLFASKYAFIPGLLLLLLGPMVGAKVGDEPGKANSSDGSISAGSCSSDGCGGGDAC